MSKKSALQILPKTPTETDDQENPSALPGWPGYRTRDGRSGYDPIDTRTEAAHVSGAFIQHLFTGQLRIRNPIYLFLSGVMGLALIAPFILAISETLAGNLLSWNGWIFLLVAAVIGLAVLTNVVKSLSRNLR